MTLINSTTSLNLDLPPSCIAFCPRNPQLFVVGTYHLHRKEQEGDLSAEDTLPERASDHDDATTEETRTQKRTGSLILFHLGDDNSITPLATTSTDFAILDIQWSLHPDALGGDVLAVAASTGLLAFYRLDACGSSDTQMQHGKLVLACEKAIADPSTLVLFLTWHPTRADTIGVTLSDGRVCLCESESWNETDTVKISEIHAHELEAWTLAFAENEQILSGGDDILLQCSHTSPPSPLYQDRKLHQAGITAILPLTSTLVITGSYDDHIRLLSLPNIGRKKCLAELNFGGGVWRLKVLSQDTAPASLSSSSCIVLLASCMHAGTRIVKLVREEDEGGADEGNEEWHFEVLARFEEHRSMNYGSDVQPGGARRKRIVSTSFYDKLLCLWEFDDR